MWTGCFRLTFVPELMGPKILSAFAYVRGDKRAHKKVRRAAMWRLQESSRNGSPCHIPKSHPRSAAVRLRNDLIRLEFFKWIVLTALRSQKSTKTRDITGFTSRRCQASPPRVARIFSVRLSVKHHKAAHHLGRPRSPARASSALLCTRH